MKLFGYEFTIKKVQKRKRYSHKVARRAWTKSEADALLRLRSENRNWEEIAGLMNRTPVACSTMYSKIKKGKANIK